MAQSQAVPQQSRGRSGTPGRTSRLAAQTSAWSPQLGTLGSTGPPAPLPSTGTPTSASQLRGPSLFVPGWELDNSVIMESTASAACGVTSTTVAAAPYGSLSHASSLGVLSSPMASGLSPPGLVLGPDRKLVPTRSGNSRAPAIQQSRSMSHPRSAGRGAPGSAGWAPAVLMAASAVGTGSVSASPRCPPSVGSPAVGCSSASATTGASPSAALLSPGSSSGAPATTASLDTIGIEAGTGQVGGPGTGSAAVASNGGGRQLQGRSGLRPSSRRGVSSAANAPGSSTTTCTSAAMAALNSGIVEPYGAAAVMGGLGSSRPRTSPDSSGATPLAAANTGSATAGNMGGYIQGVPYMRTASDGWGMQVRPNSASPLAPNGNCGGGSTAASPLGNLLPGGAGLGVGSCPPLPLTSTCTMSKSFSAASSSRRPLSAHHETQDVAQRTSRISLTCISDVPASPSLADVALGAGHSLPSLPGFTPAQISSAQTSASGGTASLCGGSSVAGGQGPKRSVSSLLVSLDGLPPGPSRLYEAITRQLEESDEDVVAAEADSSDGEEADRRGRDGVDGTGGLPEMDGRLPSGRPMNGVSVRDSSGDLQANGQPPQSGTHPQAQQLLAPSPQPQLLLLQQQPSYFPTTVANEQSQAQQQSDPQSLFQVQQQRQQPVAGSKRQQSDVNPQLGAHLAAAFNYEQLCPGSPQPCSQPSPSPSYSPLQPNIRGRSSWTGSAPLSAGAPSGASAGGGAAPGSPTAANRPSSPTLLAAPPSPVSCALYPSAPPPSPSALSYRFPTLAFAPHQTASLPPHVQALLQPPFGTGSASAPRDQATVAAAAVLAAAAGAVASGSVAAAVADIRNWFCPPSRGGPLPEDGACGGSSAPLPSQRLPGCSATAAAAAAAAIAGRPYVVNKLRLNLTAGPSSRRPSDTEYYAASAPSHPRPNSPTTGIPTTGDQAAGGAVSHSTTGLLPPAAGQRASLLSHMQQQHLSHNQQLLAQLQQQRQQQQQQQHQLQQLQQQQQQQQLFQQQLALQQQQLQRRKQQQQSAQSQQQQLQNLQQQKHHPLGKLASLAEALAAASEEDLQDYFISASAVGAPLDWEGGEVATSPPRRPLMTAWRGAGGEIGSGEGAQVSNRPSTATKNDRPTVASRPRGGGGGGGALRQQVWMEGSAQLLSASMQMLKPQLWVQNGPRPISEAVLWMMRITEAPPSGWESDGWHQRPCTRSYLEGLRSGSGAVEAAIEEEELAAARAAEQQRIAAAREAQSAPGISGRMPPWRPAPRPRVRSAGLRRRHVTSSESSEDEEEEEEEEEEEDSEEEVTTVRVRQPAAAAVKPRPRPRPSPAPRPRPAAPKPRPPAPTRGRGRNSAGSHNESIVDDE